MTTENREASLRWAWWIGVAVVLKSEREFQGSRSASLSRSDNNLLDCSVTDSLSLFFFCPSFSLFAYPLMDEARRSTDPAPTVVRLKSVIFVRVQIKKRNTSQSRGSVWFIEAFTILTNT